MKIRGYIYGIFPCEVEDGSEDVVSCFPRWAEPFFFVCCWIYGLICGLSGVEPMFPIVFYGKNEKRIARLEKIRKNKG